MYQLWTPSTKLVIFGVFSHIFPTPVDACGRVWTDVHTFSLRMDGHVDSLAGTYIYRVWTVSPGAPIEKPCRPQAQDNRAEMLSYSMWTGCPQTPLKLAVLAQVEGGSSEGWGAHEYPSAFKASIAALRLATFLLGPEPVVARGLPNTLTRHSQENPASQWPKV